MTRSESNREAGVLLHVTSLPEQGQMDTSARQFLRWLNNCGFSVWQVLPLGPTHADHSPYLSLSAHAGNPSFISLDDVFLSPIFRNSWLTEWLEGKVRFSSETLSLEWQPEFQLDQFPGFTEFMQENDAWLPDFALFMAGRSHYSSAPWWRWPAPLRDRQPEALNALRSEHESKIKACYLEQFLFNCQWQALRTLAHELNIEILGDMPLYVAHDSADVWAHRELFALTPEGGVAKQAGVPPDAFSETGQLWGNPVYDWPAHKDTSYRWWIERMTTNSRLYDRLRIDHFRGIEAYWEVPAGEITAMGGEWVPGPGEALLSALTEALPQLELVAEDLGIITPEVDGLRKQFNLPGMRIVEFAFDGDDDNPHRLFNHSIDSVVYTGTHDNDTVVGWYRSLDEAMREKVRLGLGVEDDKDVLDATIDAALASPGALAILPMQDILGLGGESRMNTPATIEENWSWQFDWDQLRGIDSRVWLERLRVHSRLASSNDSNLTE